MPFSLIPDRVLRRYTDLTPALLERWGIRLLLCDLDYTLAPRSVARPDQALRTWLADLEAAGVTVMILSNNRSGRRVNAFCGQLGIPYVGHAGKPSVRGYREAMALALGGKDRGGDRHGGGQAAHRRAGRPAQRGPGPDGGAAGRTGRTVEQAAAPAAAAI